jgi:PPIC-type PPIASE domain
MREAWLMCVLLGTLAWGQAMPGPPQTEVPPADPSAAVPATAAVITIKGVCPAQAQAKTAAAKATAPKPATPAKTTAAKSPAADCKTVITKAEFETLAGHLAPNVTPQMKKQLASLLPQWIMMSDEAKKKGLDKTPQYEDRVKVLKMQILSQELRQNIQDEAGKISPEDLEKYYKEHADAYEQFNLDRLFVPRTKQGEPEANRENDKNEKLSEEAQKAEQAEEKKKADEAEQSMTQLAESLRARAAAGEDFVKLQKEAFAAAGMKMDSPTVNLPTVRRNGLPPSQSAVFDLKPGEVSQVINDAGGHYIYKVNSKSEIPLDQVKNEIHSKLQNDRMREMMEKLNNPSQVETNEAYFGAGGVGPAPPQRPSRLAPPNAPRTQPQTAPPARPPAAPPN